MQAMNIRRHFLSVFAALLALGAPALAEDVQLYSTGTNDTLAFRLKNTSDNMRYVVFLEVRRLDIKTGSAISSHTDQHTQKGNDQEDSHAHCHCQDQRHVRNRRHLCRQHLQVRLGNGDHHSQQKR